MNFPHYYDLWFASENTPPLDFEDLPSEFAIPDEAVGWLNRHSKLRRQAELVLKKRKERMRADRVRGVASCHKQLDRRPGPMTTVEYPIVAPRQAVYYVGFTFPEEAGSDATTTVRPSSTACSRTDPVASSNLAVDDRDPNNALSDGLDDACEGSFAGLGGTVDSLSGQPPSPSTPSWSLTHTAASPPENSPQPPLANNAMSQHASHSLCETRVLDLSAQLTSLIDYTDSLRSENDLLAQSLKHARTENVLLRAEILFWLRVARGEHLREGTAGPNELTASTGATAPAGPSPSLEISDFCRRFPDVSEMS
jgi:hypothetical protein